MRMIRTIGGGEVESFEAVGRSFLPLFRDLGKLKPSDAVLDVGCGVGRMAIPLTTYLEAHARYEGFDITKEEIDWCRKHITTRFPNFNFQLSNLYNRMYNPTSQVKASSYRFPYGNDEFDFVFLASVFTHLLPEDLTNYFSEIVRVLKPGGRCFSSYFLLNDESNRLMAEGRSTQNFQFKLDGCMVKDQDNPEYAVAYKESFITGLYYKHGLKIDTPFSYGAWCGRERFVSYQDIIIAEK
jgi:SAM-dependent methyltransferase